MLNHLRTVTCSFSKPNSKPDLFRVLIFILWSSQRAARRGTEDLLDISSCRWSGDRVIVSRTRNRPVQRELDGGNLFFNTALSRCCQCKLCRWGDLDCDDESLILPGLHFEGCSSSCTTCCRSAKLDGVQEEPRILCGLIRDSCVWRLYDYIKMHKIPASRFGSARVTG